MKASFELPAEPVRAIEGRATALRVSWSEVVEAALREFLGLSPGRVPLSKPLPTFNSGGQLVDIADRDALYDAMESDDPPPPT